MRVLLDTHVWLWSVVSPERITRVAREVLEDPETTLILSAVSSWEIAIKYHLGKLPLPEAPAVFIPPRLVRDGIESLPVEHHHACRVAELPDHHGDPFDRLLVAVAQLESLTLVTADAAFDAYDVEILHA